MKQIKNWLFVFCLLSCLTFAFAQQKQNLSVLYVGYDPSIPLPEKVIKSSTGNGGMTEERFIEDYKTRFPEFKG